MEIEISPGSWATCGRMAGVLARHRAGLKAVSIGDIYRCASEIAGFSYLREAAGVSSVTYHISFAPEGRCEPAFSVSVPGRTILAEIGPFIFNPETDAIRAQPSVIRDDIGRGVSVYLPVFLEVGAPACHVGKAIKVSSVQEWSPMSGNLSVFEATLSETVPLFWGVSVNEMKGFSTVDVKPAQS